MDLLRHYLDSGFKELQKNDARIVFIGERYMLAEDIRQKMAQIEERTKENKSVTLCVALSYGSKQEIVHAARKIRTGSYCTGAGRVFEIEQHQRSSVLPKPRATHKINIAIFLLISFKFG